MNQNISNLSLIAGKDAVIFTVFYAHTVRINTNLGWIILIIFLIRRKIKTHEYMHFVIKIIKTDSPYQYRRRFMTMYLTEE